MIYRHPDPTRGLSTTLRLRHLFASIRLLSSLLCLLSAGFQLTPMALGQVPNFYQPTAGSGLTLNIAAGNTICNGAVVNFSGGTLTIVNNSTNYVYLDQSNSCAPATNTAGFGSLQIPIAKVTASGGVITGISDLRTWFVPGTVTVYNAGLFPGVDAEAKTAACVAALPSTGGTCDARGLTGAQNWGATLVLNSPINLQFGDAVFTYTGTAGGTSGGACFFNIPSTATGTIVIEGQTGLKDNNTGTVFITTDATCHGINMAMNNSVGSYIFRRFVIKQSSVTATNLGNGINVDAGVAVSTSGVIEDVDSFAWQYAIRLSTPVNTKVVGKRANGWVNSYRQEAGTSTMFENTYSVNAGQDGYVFTNEYAGGAWLTSGVWRASTAYTNANTIVPWQNANFHFYKATQVGSCTSGATEPAFTTNGTGVADGTCTWTDQGAEGNAQWVVPNGQQPAYSGVKNTANDSAGRHGYSIYQGNVTLVNPGCEVPGQKGVASNGVNVSSDSLGAIVTITGGSCTGSGATLDPGDGVRATGNVQVTVIGGNFSGTNRTNAVTLTSGFTGCTVSTPCVPTLISWGVSGSTSSTRGLGIGVRLWPDNALGTGNSGGGGALWFQQATLAVNSATPAIMAGNIFRTANTAATTITNFTSNVTFGAGAAVLGAWFCMQAGDANTTIQNGTKIFVKGGVNVKLSSNQVMCFAEFQSGRWDEVSRNF